MKIENERREIEVAATLSYNYTTMIAINLWFYLPVIVIIGFHSHEIEIEVSLLVLWTFFGGIFDHLGEIGWFSLIFWVENCKCLLENWNWKICASGSWKSDLDCAHFIVLPDEPMYPQS